jgi:hypothetical protein
MDQIFSLRFNLFSCAISMHVVNARVHAIWPPHSTGDIAGRAVATVLCRCPLVSPLQLRGGRMRNASMIACRPLLSLSRYGSGFRNPSAWGYCTG